MNTSEFKALAAAIRARVRARRAESVAFLRALVDQPSFTRDPAGVNRVGDLVARAMPAAFHHRVVRGHGCGDHHVFRLPSRGRVMPVLLVGHLDTLCPPAPAFCRFAARGPRFTGPGVNDMKGGLAVIVQALRVLDDLGRLKDLPLRVLCNADEEQGSPDSAALFQTQRGRASLALVYECGGPAGTVVTTRKGNVRRRLEITGRPDHFGNLKGRKVSAVEELARKTLALEALNRADGSVAVNVGRVGGGLAANAVAETAFLEFDCRVWTRARQASSTRAIQRLCAKPAVPGCALALEVMAWRPPMEPSPASRRLFDLIVDVGRGLGETIVEEKRGGLSDGCWLAHAGVPTVDGLGPIGDGDFTPQEYIWAETLFRRVELTANLLLHLVPAGLLRPARNPEKIP